MTMAGRIITGNVTNSKTSAA